MNNKLASEWPVGAAMQYEEGDLTVCLCVITDTLRWTVAGITHS